MQTTPPPVITIDGPSGTGKGTIAERLAETLGFANLDSGALYRSLAWALDTQHISLDNAVEFQHCLEKTQVSLDGARVLCNGRDVSTAIRQEKVGNLASVISANPLVRQRLLELQRAQRQWPGLVTDGRDMGTVVFPDAAVKIFLTASAKERARRRYKQLKAGGLDVSLRDIELEMNNRDRQDSERDISPLCAADDAVIIDTTALDVEAVFDKVIKIVRSHLSMQGCE
jgi:cytidylate kinase